MRSELDETVLIDEIDRILVSYERAEEYLEKITTGIKKQMKIWHSRRDVISQDGVTSNFNFLLPKTQRINELTIDTVRNLCNAELLVEQILRIDPNSLKTRQNISHSTSNMVGKFSLRSSGPLTDREPDGLVHSVLSRGAHEPYDSLVSVTGRSSIINREPNGFQPIDQLSRSATGQELTDPRLQLYHPKPQWNNSTANNSQGFVALRPNSTRTIQPDLSQSLLQTHENLSQTGNVKVKLQRIPPGTLWPMARIDVIDSISAFYVENVEPSVKNAFERMSQELHDYYKTQTQNPKFSPLLTASIGDFGVARFSDDSRWYRARILSNDNDDFIRVVYIDFGNIESKRLTEFYPLLSKFANLPAQAVSCTLAEALPRNSTDDETVWPQEAIECFKNEVSNKIVEVFFVYEPEAPKWPLHFVTIKVGNQTVTNSLTLKKLIEPRPNSMIINNLLGALGQQELILFNVNIDSDDSE